LLRTLNDMGARLCDVSAMFVLELLREGGVLAYVALALGALGLVFAVAALANAGRGAAVGLAITALLLATGAASAGLVGCELGQRTTDQALQAVPPGVQRDRLRRTGYREAQGAARVGFGAAVLPLLLGAVGVFAGRRRSEGVVDLRPAQGFGLPVLAIGLAALGATGALVRSRVALPEGRYHFADADLEAWSLAEALELAERDRTSGCDSLEQALRPYWQPTNTLEWPRRFTRELPAELPAWQAVADRCAQDLAARLKGGVNGWTVDRLLRSPLLHDEATRTTLLAAQPAAPRAGSPEETQALVERALRKYTTQVRRCYEAVARSSPDLAGTLVVHFTIAETGAVTTVKDVSPKPFHAPNVTTCVLALVRKLTFPADVGPREVSYSFVFAPG
jgi:hypothetical protein